MNSSIYHASLASTANWSAVSSTRVALLTTSWSLGLMTIESQSEAPAPEEISSHAVPLDCSSTLSSVTKYCVAFATAVAAGWLARVPRWWTSVSFILLTATDSRCRHRSASQNVLLEWRRLQPCQKNDSRPWSPRLHLLSRFVSTRHYESARAAHRRRQRVR